MKKSLLIALAALFVTTNVFAQDAQKAAENQFKFNGAAYAYWANYQLAEKDKSAGYSAYRFRPYFSYNTANVEAALKFEIDQVFGKGTTGSVDVGNDEKGIVEVKAAYLKFMLPFLQGASVKGGADEFKSVGGFVIGTEIGGGFFNYKNDMMNLNIVAAQVYEPTIVDTKDDTTSEDDDSTFYAADIAFKVGDISIRPAIYVITFEKNHTNTLTDTTAYIPSIGLSAKFGALNLDFAGAYGTASKDANDVKYSGYAVDLAPSFKASDDLKVGAFFTMLSGDDPESADEVESFNTFQLKGDGFGRMFLLEDKMNFSNAGPHDYIDIRDNDAEYMMVGAMIEYKMSPLKFMAQAAWAQLSEEASNEEKDLGTEIDVAISYEIEKNAAILFEGAYLATGKAFEATFTETQNSTYVGLGLNYKW
ncbi:MAG: hypothetical protein JXN64_12760 [Spirochaetes bacterium]|nr:hypothetical protein [Spirochaetota bacterium]